MMKVKPAVTVLVVITSDENGESHKSEPITFFFHRQIWIVNSEQSATVTYFPEFLYTPYTVWKLYGSAMSKRICPELLDRYNTITEFNRIPPVTEYVTPVCL